MQNSGESKVASPKEELESFRNLRDLLPNIIREIESGSLDSNTVDVLHFRLNWLFDVYGIDEQIVNLIRGARDRLVGNKDVFGACLPLTALTGQRGRPKYLIPRDQLEFRIDRRFTVVGIVSLLGVGVRTIERRLSDYG